jgi:hypothetical protein
MERNELESMDQSTHADSPVMKPSSECDRTGLGRTPLLNHKKPRIEPQVCGLESCHNVCGKNKKNGTYFRYCSKNHKKLANKKNAQHKPGTYAMYILKFSFLNKVCSNLYIWIHLFGLGHRNHVDLFLSVQVLNCHSQPIQKNQFVTPTPMMNVLLKKMILLMYLKMMVLKECP